MFKRFLWVIILVLGAERGAAYSISGPFETYQTPALGYTYQGDLGGPHNLGEEYRRNTPVIYYTFDESFTTYFGSNGVAAIEEAFAIYNSLTNVSHYSNDLSEWPLETRSYNFKANALNLSDLKSYFLSVLTEQMGLNMPERYVWTLHDRDVGPGGCPADVQYLVHKRNFDPVFSALDVLQPTSYVNGSLYSYFIFEGCTTTPVAEAIEFAVDPLADSFNSVAGFNLAVGAYFNGLTRDDVGGLRYLLRTNNANIESTGADTVTFITNNAPQLLFTSNLTELITAALTNNAAALSALFPNLQIGSTTPIFTNVITTNTVFFFTNNPWTPGTPLLTSAIFRTTNVTTHFSHTFLNVFITPAYQLVSNLQVPIVPGHTTSGGVIQVLTTNISTTACPPFTPGGTICTNISLVNVPSEGFFGDYYILPTNFCSIQILSTQLIQQVTVTNATIVATNAPGTTNTAGEVVFSQTPTYTFNQYVYVINPVTCPTNYVDRRQGIERIQFIRYDGGFDSFTGQYAFPITNQYTLTAMPVTNPTPVLQTVRRRVAQPDIIISAMDLTTEQSVNVRGGTYTLTGFGAAAVLRNINFNEANVLPNLYGPGTIDPGTEVTLNNVGPLFLNFTPFNLDEASQTPFFAWGSFDGSTNEPVVYPNGTSMAAYEQSLFIVVTPNLLPEGYVAATPVYTNFYSAQLTATSYTPSFTPPFTWTLSPATPGGLPPGLTLNAATGLISGIPTTTGPTGTTYDFIVRVTDSQSRVTDRSYFILIRP